MEASTKPDRYPRAHAWESPRSIAQGLTLLLVVYIVAVSAVCTIPALFDIVHVATPPHVRIVQYAKVLLQWSPFTGVLAMVVLSCYVVVSFKDPGTGQPLLEADANKNCLPICAHCNWPLHPETREIEGLSFFTCGCCGALAGAAGDDLLGLWAYGLHGTSELQIRSHASGNYEILEGYSRAVLRRISSLTAEENEDIYEADCLNDTKIRIVLLGHNALRISRFSASVQEWQPSAVARRKVGGGVVGEWSMPVWDYDALDVNSFHPMPDCWQFFEVTSMPGTSEKDDLIIREERFCGRRKELAFGIQAILEPNEVAQGVLRLDTSVLSEEGSASCVTRQTLVAQLHTEQGGKPCGWVRLEVESDHLIYQYRPADSGCNAWGPQCVALRGGAFSFACCERCGLASQPPSSGSRYAMGHCNYCNKCIPGFDHHCIFLNQCVGQRNYQEWLLLIVCLLALGVAALLAALLVLFASSRHIFGAFNRFFLPSLQRSWCWALAEVGVVMGSIVLDVFLFQLVALHCWLILQKQTTAGSVFNTTANAAYDRRRTRHLWRLCQSVAKRRCLPLPPPPPTPSSQSWPGTPSAFARSSPLSLSLPGTPNAFARHSPNNMSLGSFSPAHQSEAHRVESEGFSPRSSWCGSPKRSVDVVTARALCAGTTLDSADEDFSGPFLELHRGKADLLDMSPSHRCSLSSPLLQKVGGNNTVSSTPRPAQKQACTVAAGLEADNDDPESPASKALSFSGLSVTPGNTQ